MKTKGNFPAVRSVVGAVCLILFGLLLLCNPDFGSAVISNIIGWALLVFGILGIVYCVTNWVAAGWIGCLIAVAVTVVGIVLLANPLLLAKLLGIALGIYLIAQGVDAILVWNRLHQADCGSPANLVLAILMTVLGAVLLFVPLTTSRVLMTLAGLAMMGCGIFSLVIRSRTEKLLHTLDAADDDPNIVDADQ